jgi:alkylated DNA nucleotide flippase Atl1
MSKTMTIIDRVAEQKPAQIKTIPEGFPGFTTYPGGTMVVSSAGEVDAILRRVPSGSVVTLDDVRAHLARRYGTNIACPVSTAIFINMTARASDELAARGEEDVTPYWRVLKADGTLNDKYPGGAAAQKTKLETEGFTIVPHRKTWRVEDYAARRFDLEGV